MADVDFAVFELTPERQIAGKQAMGILTAAVSQLPPKCRQAFLLHRIYNTPIEEIAKQLGIGECMVRRYVARGLDHIRRCLDAAGYQYQGPGR
jgi:RNA polymerase sigma-70 factor (ECF subfamily)